MINLKKQSMKELMNEIGVDILPNQIFYVVKNPISLIQSLEGSNIKDINDCDIKQLLSLNSEYINKEKYTFCIAANLKAFIQSFEENLQLLTPNEQIIYLDMKKKFSKCKQLLENTDVEFPYLDYDKEGKLKIKKFLTTEYLFDEKNKNSKKNKIDDKSLEIYKNIDEKIGLENILKLINIKGTCQYISKDNDEGSLFEYVAKVNVDKEIENIDKSVFYDIEDKEEIKKALEEMINNINIQERLEIIRSFPEKFDFSSLLLVCAKSVINSYENDWKNIDEETNIIYTSLLQNIGEIIEDTKCKIQGYILKKDKNMRFDYSVNNLKRDLQRIVEGRYYSSEEISYQRQQFLEGSRELNDTYSEKLFDLINFGEKQKLELLKKNACNFQYMLSRNKLSNDEIQKIINNWSGEYKLDTELLEILYQEGKIHKKDIINCFMKDNIDFNEILKFNQTNSLESEINVNLLMENYYHSLDDSEENISQFIKFIKLFNEVKKANQSEEYQKELENAIVAKLYEKEDRNYEKDLMNLYQSNLLSIETVVDWGDTKLIYDLMSQNALKSRDVKKLLDDDLLDINKIKNILIKYSDAEKVNFIYTMFNGKELNQRNIRKELMQTLNGKIGFEERKKQKIYETDDERYSIPILDSKEKHNQYIVDPMLRWQFIQSLDKDCTNKMYSRDTGVFILPNVNNGSVVIEKLLKNTSNGVIYNYGSATYTMSLDEFYKNKDEIIINDRISRGTLMDLYTTKKADKFSHAPNWSYKMLESLNISLEEKSQYSDKEIDNIKNLAERIKEERELIN